MKIIDMHCDTILEGWEHPEIDLVAGDATSITLEKLKKNHSLAQFFALWLPWKQSEMTPYELYKDMYAYYQKFMEANADKIRPVYHVADIEENEKNGFLSAMLTVEDGVFLEGQIDRVSEAYDMGVRLITLLWNHENSLGYPNNDDPALHAKGLKPFGIEAVEEMNRLGIIVDVSHLSEGGFWDVAKHSKKPFMASHSCARALCDHRRNLTDEQLKAIGESGGMVGINFEKSFLKEGNTYATFEQIIRHLLYMKDKAGIDALGFGSDFDGIEDAGELVDYNGFKNLLQAMEKHFTPAELDKICRENALRLLGDVL